MSVSHGACFVWGRERKVGGGDGAHTARGERQGVGVDDALCGEQLVHPVDVAGKQVLPVDLSLSVSWGALLPSAQNSDHGLHASASACLCAGEGGGKGGSKTRCPHVHGYMAVLWLSCFSATVPDALDIDVR